MEFGWKTNCITYTVSLESELKTNGPGSVSRWKTDQPAFELIEDEVTGNKSAEKTDKQIIFSGRTTDITGFIIKYR